MNRKGRRDFAKQARAQRVTPAMLKNQLLGSVYAEAIQALEIVEKLIKFESIDEISGAAALEDYQSDLELLATRAALPLLKEGVEQLTALLEKAEGSLQPSNATQLHLELGDDPDTDEGTPV